MLTTDRRPIVNELLGASLASLDIPDSIYEIAVARYEGVAGWLDARWEADATTGVIYPQGSFRLGTVVRPMHRGGHYDIDLVCRRNITKDTTTQTLLRAEVGDALAGYVATEPDGLPMLDEGKRCWTLAYPAELFHMDVLPAILDQEARPLGILLTDRQFVRWQHSNPIGFADWFYGVMVAERLEVRAVLAKQMQIDDVPEWKVKTTLQRAVLAKQMQIDDVPEWKVKTTLQRAVQALKRHRDIYFTDRPELAPASVIITTLAGRSYSGIGDLYEVVVSVAERMPLFVEMRDGVHWVVNPVQKKENFADRWQATPEKADAFFEWITVAHRDLAALGDDGGVDRIITRITKSFGKDAAEGAGSALGRDFRESRDRGDLRMAARTGALGVAGSGSIIPKHTFHGDAPASSSRS